MSVRFHFHDVPHAEALQELCSQQAEELQTSFPEALKFEVTLRHDADEFEANVHVTGKDVEVVAHAKSHDGRRTLDDAFERARRQLRKHHDKLFERRRKHPQAKD